MTEQEAIISLQKDKEMLMIDLGVPEELLIEIDMAKAALEEIQQYRALGTVEELRKLKESALSGLELANIWAALRELKKYEAMGTLEELRKLKNKQNPPKSF